MGFVEIINKIISEGVNWSGVTLFVGVIYSICKFYKLEVLRRRAARFDIAISKIYSVIERFIFAANKVKDNINTMPSSYLTEHKPEEMDEWITYPIKELENAAIMTQMFFSSRDRECFNEMVEAAQDFNFESHKAYSVSDEIEQQNIYDKAKREFNKRFKSCTSKMVDMLHDQVLGDWEYDITKLRVPTPKSKQEPHKRNQ